MGGLAGQIYHVITICIVPLVQEKCEAFDIQRQIWQYKVKHDRRWRKLPWFKQVKVPAVLWLEMTSA